MEPLKLSEEVVAAFWSKVDVKDPKECWEWIGARNTKNYGNLRINKQYRRAHRVAYELSNFVVPEGYQVCHVCDNPPCCNPHHLMLGTVRSNFMDMVIKNRGQFHKNKAIGERNCNAKFKESDIMEIRKLYKDGKMNQYELAEKYGVRQPTIGCIVRKETWKHIGE